MLEKVASSNEERVAIRISTRFQYALQTIRRVGAEPLPKHIRVLWMRMEFSSPQNAEERKPCDGMSARDVITSASRKRELHGRWRNMRTLTSGPQWKP